jgi:outer membrane protein, heavy metal efflux system
MSRSTGLLRWLGVPLLSACCALAQAQSETPGATVESLLAYARDHNPEFASMRLEAEAAAERVAPAGALPDPKFRAEWRDVTRTGEQSPTLLPGRVGSTRYLLMQDLPWFGKRGLKGEIAEHEAEGARGRSQGTWAELSARLKATYAEYYYVGRSLVLTREILDLMGRLENVAQVRYAGGLGAQQDVIRAQVELTNLRTELVAMETEHHHLHSRLNALLARPFGSPLAAPLGLRPLPTPGKLDYVALAERVRTNSPQLAVEDARVKAAEKGRDLTYKNRYPDFTLGIAPTQYQSEIREWELMLELNIPLQQGARRAQERESEALLSSAQARREATSNVVLADLAENLSALEAAQRTERLTVDSLLPQAELTLQAALAGYENGKVDFATLLDAQRQIRLARQNQLKTQAQAQARLAEIERILGEDL